MAHADNDCFPAVELLVCEFTGLKPPPCFFRDRLQNNGPTALDIIRTDQTSIDAAQFRPVLHFICRLCSMLQSAVRVETGIKESDGVTSHV